MTRSLVKVLAAAGLIAGCGSSGSPPTKDSGPGSDGATGGTDGSASDGGTDMSAAPQMIMPPLQPTMDGTRVPKYVDDVPTFNGRRIDGKAAVTVDMVEFQQKILPATAYAGLPAPFNAGTYLWGYKINGGAPSFPSVTIEATRGTATSVTYTNSLEGTGGAPLFLQRRMVTDLSVHSADPLGFGRSNNCLSEPPLPVACIGIYQFPIPAVAHLHGAEVLSDFDGMPDTWFTAGMAYKGPAYVSNVYMYPNTQEATTLWFHDHALGLTRQHVYAGLAGFYLIRDANDTGAAANSMSLPAGAYESELMVADRQFDISGQLYFPAGAARQRTGVQRWPAQSRPSPVLDPRVLRRRHDRQRQVVAGDARRAAPLPACGSSTRRTRASSRCSSSPPTRWRADRRRPGLRSGRSAPTADSSTPPRTWTRTRYPESSRAGRARRRHRRLHRQDRQLHPDQRQGLRRSRERRQLRRVRALPRAAIRRIRRPLARS